MRALATLLASTLLLAACGGGGGGSPAPSLPPVSYYTEYDQPSFARFDGFVNTNGVVRTDGICGITGDLDTSTRAVGSMQFFRFDHGVLPAGANIVEARLEVYQENVVGTPYASHGVVVVDQMDLGPNLLASDYFLVPVQAEVGVISRDAFLGFKSVDVTEAIRRSAASGWERTHFRLRWSGGNTNNDGNFDFAVFSDGEDSCGTGHYTRLYIRWE